VPGWGGRDHVRAAWKLGPARSAHAGEENRVGSHKAVVRQLVLEVLNGGRLEVIDELYAPELAPATKRWNAPFRASFPDVQMEIVELIAEGDKVVGRFTCSATHLGEWLGHGPTGRRFERVGEVSIFRLREGRIIHAWSLEDTSPDCGNSDSPHSRGNAPASYPCQAGAPGPQPGRPVRTVAVTFRGRTATDLPLTFRVRDH
jgi:hypothetical protein